MSTRRLPFLLALLAGVGVACSSPPEKRSCEHCDHVARERAAPAEPVDDFSVFVQKDAAEHRQQRVDLARITQGPPLPAIDAKVAAVRADSDPVLVLLTVGSDDGVERGYHFSVYRGTEFIGKVVVEKVLRDSSGCRVLFTKEGSTIQQGDSAATRLQ